MNRFKNWSLTIAVLVMAAFVFSGCEGLIDPNQGDIAVEGAWILEGAFDWDGNGYTNSERWIIDNTSIEYSSSLDSTDYTVHYKADIIRYSNSSLNGSDTEFISGTTGISTGYAIIRFTEVENSGWGEVGKYQIFRWATSESNASLRDFSQGSLDSDPGAGFVNTVYTTAFGAEFEATSAAGHFAFSSSGAKSFTPLSGTWQLDGAYGSERWTFTDTTAKYESDYGSGFSTVYEADIVFTSFSGLNGGDAQICAVSPTSTENLGYAIIKYTAVDGVGTGAVDKYNILRWGDNDTDLSLRDFSQGSKDSNLDGDDDPWTGTYTNLVFDSAADAETGATNAAGYFDYGSAGAAKQ